IIAPILVITLQIADHVNASIATSRRLGARGRWAGDPDIFLLRNVPRVLGAIAVTHATRASLLHEQLSFIAPPLNSPSRGLGFPACGRAAGEWRAVSRPRGLQPERSEPGRPD